MNININKIEIVIAASINMLLIRLILYSMIARNLKIKISIQ